MVAAVVDVLVNVNVPIHVLHHDCPSDVADIWSPIRNAVVKIGAIKRTVIRDVVGAIITDAHTGVVSASTKAEKSRKSSPVKMRNFTAEMFVFIFRALLLFDFEFRMFIEFRFVLRRKACVQRTGGVAAD